MSNQLLLLIFATNQKIQLFRAIREITRMGLMDTKNAVEQGMIVSSEEVFKFLSDLREQVKSLNTRVQPSYTCTYEVKIEPYSLPVGRTCPSGDA